VKKLLIDMLFTALYYGMFLFVRAWCGFEIAVAVGFAWVMYSLGQRQNLQLNLSLSSHDEQAKPTTEAEAK